MQIPLGQKNKKIKKMKKSIMILIMMTAGFFSSGQSSTDSVYTGPLHSVKANDVTKSETKDLTQAGLSKAIETGSIYNSTSPYHNVLHEFTYSTAMLDYCNKTLLQMHANREVNKKLSKKLKTELSKSRAALASAKFNGLKIEPGQYEVFLKQINERFRD